MLSFFYSVRIDSRCRSLQVVFFFGLTLEGNEMTKFAYAGIGSWYNLYTRIAR